MMKTKCLSGYLVFSFLIFANQVLSQTLDYRGQLSGWVTFNPKTSWRTQTGLRYIPSASAEKSISSTYYIDSEFSLNSYGFAIFNTADETDTGAKIKAYRIWLRITAAQFGLRIGLQKINFGSALILRPLMWFDRIDPRDPIQLTDGVYAALFRYYFPNNSNFWLWTLYGNNDLKGWEIIPTDKNTLEIGGRFQIPLSTGEIAVTYHHRVIDTISSIYTNLSSPANSVPENRIGFDGKWDIGIGCWFEGVFLSRDVPDSELKYQKLLTIGTDYTFSIGNGLHILNEYLITNNSNKLLNNGNNISFSALALDYPLSLIDNISLMLYYQWNSSQWYRFINLKRLYDHFSFYLIGFWNPSRFEIYNSSETNLYTGKGFQIMLVLNH